MLLLLFAFFLSTEQAPPARTGDGPYDGQHCHQGEFLVPPRNSAGHHTHDGFHSGEVPSADWGAFSAKYRAHLDDPAVGYSGPSANDRGNNVYLVTFPSHWKPDGQRVWHNHGDNDVYWWTPDSNNCAFAPYFIDSPYTFDVDENEAAGVFVGRVQAYDEDGEEPRYSLVGGDTGQFAIDSASGELKTRRMLDYERKNSYSITVRARDPGGRTDRASVSISVGNVEEEGQVTLSGAARFGSTVTAQLSDPDGNVSDETWKWEKADSNTGPWVALSGSKAKTYEPESEDASKYLRATVSYTDGHGEGKSATSEPVRVRAQADPTPTPTPTNTPTPTPTKTPTPTPTNTPTPTATQRANVSPVNGSTNTPTPTATAVPLSAPRLTPRPTTRATSTPTRTPTVTPSPTPTPTKTATPTPSPTPTATLRPTSTPTSAPPNSPPFFVDGERTERAVTAEAGANSAVGAPVVATDPDGDPVTYSRDGADMGHFILNTVSGQVWTAKSLPAGRQSFALRLWVEDGRGGTDSIEVRVVVEGAEPTKTPAPAPVLVELPTSTPTPTPVVALQVRQKAEATPTLKPIPDPTATIDSSGWGPGRKIGTATPTPEWDIPVVDIGIPRPPDPVVLAQSGPVPGQPPFWPRLATWLGGLGLIFALVWLLLMALRDRRRERARERRLARPGAL